MPGKDAALQIVRRLRESGYIAYFAGGWVRDYLMGAKSDDIDIVTSALPQEIQKLFKKTIPVGIQFGIVIVVEENKAFEVATFRRETGYTDGRRPDKIEPAPPEEDAKRRDFTINGLFYDPIEHVLLDYVEGQKDIHAQLIRCIGSPHERFLEDRLRMMRAIRYATRFGFSIDPGTLSAMREHASALLPAVAMERIWQEFKKMSQFAHFDQGLLLLFEVGLLPTIFPSLKNFDIETIRQRLLPISQYPSGVPAIGELLELFPDLDAIQLSELFEYLKLSNHEKQFGKFLHHAKQLLSIPAGWKLEKAEWARFYAHPDSAQCLEIYAARLPTAERHQFLEAHFSQKKSLEASILRIQQKTPVITSQDLLQAGMAPGPLMGRCLQEAERISINEDIHDKKTLLDRLRAFPEWRI